MKKILARLFAAFCFVAAFGAQAADDPLKLPLSAIPPNILANSNLPMVMLSASKDFTMFWKAYTDFDDIDNSVDLNGKPDHKVDLTFRANFQYYGYFDPVKCYVYSSSNGQFEPTRLADKEEGNYYYCQAGKSEWSGNFLNWVSMSRIDVLRKVLYGGLRSTDTADGQTTLELSFVPRNSQAFVKYYNRSDIDRLTPFSSADVKAKGLTFCRRSAENTGLSQQATFTPEIRVALGNYVLWNMTEVRTCNWSSEINYTWKTGTLDFLASNYVTPEGSKATGNFRHPASVPTKGTVPGGTNINTSYIARVKVCVPSVDDVLFGTENCKGYGTPKKSKPAGLLQEFGESADPKKQPAAAEFGLMMGSYDSNLDGGVLRKNMGPINDEINSDTGQFVTPAVGSGGIIQSFNKMTLYGYDENTGNYSDTCYSNDISNGKCPSWGNPVGELLLEAMRFYAAKTPAYTSGDKDKAIGLPTVTKWKDPIKDDPVMEGTTTRSKLYGQGMCRPMNLLTVTSGSSSYDDSAMSSFTDLNAPSSAASITSTLGDKEGVTGTVRLVGTVGANADGLCTGKTISALGSVAGICADGPNFKGTYLGAGVAYYANTHEIRSDMTARPADLPGTAFKVRSYGVSMSGGVATIEVPIGDKIVYITPASLDSIHLVNGSSLPGNMVDFKILNRADDGSSGAALVLWQHSMLGEDQDQDMLGSLRWKVNATTPPTITVYTQTVESDTGSTSPYAFGYTIVGTNEDRVHFHSGINGYVSTETGVDLSLATDNNNCDGRLCVVVRTGTGTNTRKVRGETSKTYTMLGGTDALIREPLWYISKYGGFKYDKKKPEFSADYPTADNLSAWDVKRADARDCGGATGLSCSDGEPDNYFVARSPKLLEDSLRGILEDIVNSSNTAPAVAASQLRAGDLKYVARFDSGDGRGELWAYQLDKDTGLFKTTEEWRGHELLTKTAPEDRSIITNNAQTGVAFTWDTIGALKQTTLKSDITDVFGKAMLQWLRGDTVNNRSSFRVRAATSILGPIVNSNPTVEIAPNGNYFGTAFAGYASFVNTWRARKSILWVGAGDGMLHAFNAGLAKDGGGKPLMSYIPSPVFDRLPDWASASKPKVQAFVDGSPFTGDVKIGTSWSTYLFGTLGRGGKGMFALDVTDPNKIIAAQTRPTDVFKWQFTETDDDNPNDLGYIISEPTVSRISNQAGQIVPLNNGKFAAMFGNGVLSNSGKAVLYLLFADGPSGGNWSGNYVKLVADTGSGNGLSQPMWVDENNDGIADSIYAGDLKGNLWKFDVSSKTSSEWKVAYENLPLFIAQAPPVEADKPPDLLPITGAPEFRFHPSGGLLITVATGKSFAVGDFPNAARKNGVFGIWDNPKYKADNISAAELAATLPRRFRPGAQPTTDLVLRTLSGTLQRTVTGADIDWNDPKNKGWYMPFNVVSEMSVSNLAIVNGQVAIVSVAPPPAKANANDPDPCFITPQALLTVVDPFSGKPNGLLGTTDDGTFIATIPIDDQKVGIGKDSVSADCQKGTKNCIRVEGDKTDKQLSTNNGSQRIFWREIPGLKTKAAP